MDNLPKFNEVHIDNEPEEKPTTRWGCLGYLLFYLLVCLTTQWALPYRGVFDNPIVTACLFYGIMVGWLICLIDILKHLRKGNNEPHYTIINIAALLLITGLLVWKLPR